MRNLFAKLSRPWVVTLVALLFVLGIVAWSYWMGAAAAR